MIEQGLFKRHFVGRDGFIWWIGQVVSEEKWAGNIPAKPTRNTSDHAGFGERYKVRIMGYHTANKKELSDDELPWASVMYPVTAGGGGAGTWSNAAIRQGNFVFGFFIDGEDAQQPVIMGVLGTNQYTALASKDNPDIAFFPFSGYTNTNTVARYSLTLDNTTSPPATQTGSTQKPSNKGKQEGVAGQELSSGSDKEQYENGKVKNPIPKPSTCEPVPLGAIQRRIKNLIADIERIKKTAGDWETKVSTKIANIEEQINKQITKASEYISGGIKWLIEEVQKYTTNKINNTMKDTYYLLFPNQRPKLKKAVETANDLIACLFRKIISNLLKMVGKFLLAAVDRFINTPLCAVENFVGALVGKLAGLITSAVDAILGPVKAIVGAAFDLAGGILNFITDLLSFLSCEEKPSCAEIKEWSIWEGSESVATLDLNSIVNKVQNVASTITQAIDPNNFNFDLDFTDVFDSLNSCNVGPIFCGPPIVEFYGGGGSGATGNAIIGAAGDILGVDIISPGSGYSSPPFVNFKDNCGNGRGASGRAILGQVPVTGGETGVTQTTGVVNVVIDQSGTGYLPSPDGSQGGDGRTWAQVGDTIVKRANGTYDSPYKSGQVINLNPGDTVQSPSEPTYTVNEPTTITAPEYNVQKVGGNSPTLNDGEYPVILEVGDVFISDSGFSYENGDNIVVSPSNGLVLEPKFDSLGSLTKINVINPGQGFKEFPNIYIESDTGYNAKIIPIFNVRRVDEESQVPVNGIINVVDCVGKF
jgi:hypothetical protein